MVCDFLQGTTLKILIPILGFGKAGGNRVLSKLANKWVEAGHKVDFLVPTTSSNPYFPTTAGVIWTDAFGRTSVGERPPSAPLRPSGFLNVLSLWLGLWKLGRFYDVILANHSFTAWPVAFAPVGGCRFYYIQAYEPEYYDIKGQWLNKLISKFSYFLGLVPITNAPIYCSYREIKSDYWVPPGLDFENFSPRRNDTICNRPTIITIGCIGRAEKTKGTQYVLEAFEMLHKEDTSYRLKVAYGNLPEGYAHPAVEVVLPKNDLDLAEFYRSIDVLVAPGTVQHGAAHYPVMEAMACGVAVVTTGYLPATAFNSWLVPNKDPNAIKSAILNLASNQETAAKINQASVDIASYSWKAVSDQMLRIFLKFLPLSDQKKLSEGVKK